MERDPELIEEYQQMADDAILNAEAIEWSEGLIGDVAKADVANDD